MNALFDLEGRTAMVTGGSSGLGRAMALALAEAGARIVLVARREQELQETVAAVESLGAQGAYLVADLANRNAIETLAAQASSSLGPPDILVNAAGVNLRQPIEEVTYQGWDLQIQLHLATPFFLSRSLVPAMKSKGWGRIINIASLQSYRAFPNSAPYGAAKGGIVQLTRAMAESWSRYGINCNAIGPGFFPTELTAAVFNDASKADMNAAQTAIGRNGRLEDIKGPTVFLASPASDYITGQTLFVDGGFTAK